MRAEHRGTFRADNSPMTDTETAALVAEADQIPGEDERQEYLTLRLEGESRATAIALSRRADPNNAAARDLRDGSGRRPLQGNALHSHQGEVGGSSLTLDTRTAEEREAAWLRQDFATGYVQALAPLDRRIVELRYGIGTGDPLGPSDVARSLGISISKVERTIQRLRKTAGAA